MQKKVSEHASAALICESERGYKVDHGIFSECKHQGLHFHDCYEILIHVRNGPYYYAGQQVLIPKGESFREIAAECGFKDYSNFLRASTKLTVISPSAWRKQHESQQTETR